MIEVTQTPRFQCSNPVSRRAIVIRLCFAPIMSFFCCTWAFQETVVEMLVLVRHESLDTKLYFEFDAENKRVRHYMI